MNKHILSLFLFLVVFVTVMAQPMTTVRGKIIDTDGETVPYAEVKFRDGAATALSNADGDFVLSGRTRSDFVQFGALGYNNIEMQIVRGIDQLVSIKLEYSSSDLGEIVVSGRRQRRYRDEKAVSLQKMVIDHKKNNAPEYFDSYEFKEQSQIQIGVYNVAPGLKTIKLFKPFWFVFDYADTVDGVEVMPAVLAERLSDIFVQNNPKKRVEYVNASQFSGAKRDGSKAELLNELFPPFTAYDDVFLAGGKSFASPFSNTGLSSYRYFLTDSTVVDGVKRYRLDFSPRQVQMLALSGTAWVEDSTYAILSFEFVLPPKANLNFVNTFYVKQDFEKIDGQWVDVRNYMRVGFSIFKRSTDIRNLTKEDIKYSIDSCRTLKDSLKSELKMLLKDEELSREEKQSLKEDYQTQIDNANYDRRGHKKSLKQKRREKMQIMLQQTKTKADIQIGTEIPDTIFRGEKLQFDSAAYTRDTGYWTDNRIVELTQQQENIFLMIDSVKKKPAFTTWKWLADFAVTGYMPFGILEVGRIDETVSWNEIEGVRPKLALRTTDALSEAFQLWGYAAYGTKDEDWKYLGRAFFNLPTRNERWHNLLLSYQDDFRFLSNVENDDPTDHDDLVEALLRNGPLNKIMRVEEYRGAYTREWIHGLTTELRLSRRSYLPTAGNLEFIRTDANGGVESLDGFNVSEVTLRTRIGLGETWLQFPYRRISTTSLKPIIELDLAFGIKPPAGSKLAPLGGDYSYQRIYMNYYHRFSHKAGYTRYTLRAGYVFGEIPYPLTFIHEGNNGYFYLTRGFNMIREFEFISDRFATLWVDHHFDGQILNRIPGINRLKLRTILTGKVLIGDFSARNKEVLDLPEGTRIANKPYFEVGFGIENILYVFRLDFIWRLSALDALPNTGIEPNRFGVKISFSPKF
ncbi:MAG: DUF5686 family protein [Chitinophagales bacterium]